MLRLVLLRLLESYFRHRFLILLPIVVMAGVFAASFSGGKPNYISRGAIYVEKQSLLTSLTALRQDGISWVTPAQETVNEFKELMQTDAFIRAIIQHTDLEKDMSQGPADIDALFDAVRELIWAQTLGDNLVLVGAANEDAAVAEQLADGLAEAYMAWKITNEQQSSAVAQQFFTQLIVTYQAALDLARDELQTFLVDHPDPVRGDRPSTEQLEIARLQAAVDDAARRLQSAMEKEENARLTLTKAESDTRQKYLVVDAPAMPLQSEVSQKSKLMQGVIFIVIGAVLSVVAVVGGALLDRSLRFPIDARNGLSLPVIAAVPYIREKKKRAKAGSPPAAAPPSSAATDGQEPAATGATP